MPSVRPRHLSLRLAAVLGIVGCTGGASPLRPPSAAFGDRDAADAAGRADAAVPRRTAAAGPVVWTFRAGAPLAAPPAIAPDGGVVVGSVDGYLHALRPDGSFRWGYTLRGPLVGRPAVTDQGVVFAAAEPNGLYALDVDGSLLWVTSIVGGLGTPPTVDRQSRVWVATRQGTLLGFSSRGGIVGFARLGAGAELGPRALPGGGVAVASVDGTLRLAGGAAKSTLFVGNPPLSALESNGESLFVVGASGLSRVDASDVEERWLRSAVSRLACSSPRIVVVEGQGVRWLSPAGEPGPLVSLAVGVERPVACLSDGSLLVGDDSGSVVRVQPGGVTGRVSLPPGRLEWLEPARSGVAIAGYRDGRVLAFRAPS